MTSIKHVRVYVLYSLAATHAPFTFIRRTAAMGWIVMIGCSGDALMGKQSKASARHTVTKVLSVNFD